MQGHMGAVHVLASKEGTRKMAHPVRGIDHVFLLVNDLDTSLAQYERLGFTVSPRGMHSAAKGSANHTIMFPENYFELLGLLTETEGNKARRDSLAKRGQGLHAIACRIHDAADAQKQLAELGIGTHGLNDFARPVPLSGGGTGEAAFSTLLFNEDETPLGTTFMCQHKTPEMVWLPELLEHENGAVELIEIVGMSETPNDTGKRFARLFADGTVTAMNDSATVSTGAHSAQVTFATSSALARRYPECDLSLTPDGAFAAMCIRVYDLAQTRAYLDDHDIPYTDTGTTFVIGPEAASGTIIEFSG